MSVDLARDGPAELAAGLGSGRAVDRAGAKKMHEEVEAAGGDAPDLVPGNGVQIRGAVPRLLEELSPCGVLQTLVRFHVPAGQESRAREGNRVMLADEGQSSATHATPLP